MRGKLGGMATRTVKKIAVVCYRMAVGWGKNTWVPRLRGVVSQVHPVFMLPPLAASWFGAFFARDISITFGVLHMLAMFFAVYTAHVKDGYIDYYVRGEDESHPLSAGECRVLLIGATAGFVLVTGILGVLVDSLIVLLTVPTWVIAYLHAPYLDTNPVSATVGYPGGIALAVLGGYYVQVASVSPAIVGYAVVLLFVLMGVKIIDDEQDVAWDQAFGKRTVSVALGRERGRDVAAGLFLSSGIVVLWGTVTGVFPRGAPIAIVGFGVLAGIALRKPAPIATMLLIRSVYVFFALLLGILWFHPFESVILPDIGVFGQYTYLVTELWFGAFASVLVYYANAVRAAVKTIFVVYPVAYVWDWYTLSVGVFSITMRTGYTVFGIPIEEHVFMLVVPALVIGIHETLRTVTFIPTAAVQDQPIDE